MASSGNSECPASNFKFDLVATALAKEFNFLWSSEVNCEKAIKKVSALLEEGHESRQMIWLEREQVYDNLLRCIEARVPSSRRDDNDAVQSIYANRRYGVLHSAVRTILKLEQHLFSEWKAERRTWNTVSVRRIVNALLDVVKDQDCPSDIVFLAGTAFSFHLHSLEVNAAEEAARLFIVTLFGDKGLQDTIVALDVDVVLALKSPPLHALPLMYGLFVCGKSDILMSECGASNSGPVVLQLFQWVAKFCETCNVGREYQAFQTLVAWLRCIERNVTLLAVHFDASSPLLDVIMRLLDLGWCSPVTGVADLSWDAFRVLLQVHRNEKLVTDLLSATLNLSWTTKGKYPRLAAIIKYVGAAQLLIERPNFLEELSESLASSRMSSASRVVYRAFSMQFRSELGDLSDEELAFRCDQVFHPSLIGALHSSSSITVHNAIRHWLPVTLQVFPSAFVILMCCLNHIHRRKHSAESLLVVLSTLRLARSQGIIDNSSWTLQLPDFGDALRHFDDEIRAEAFAVVCSSKKKSECVCGVEMEFIRKFLPINLNVDNASFRRKLLCNFKYLLVRLRSHCIRLLSKAEKDISQVDSVSLSETTDFLHWLIDVSQGGLLPGGCYQRRTTCLGLYKCILDVFVSTPSGNSRKGIVPDKCENLLDYWRRSGKCSILDSANERRLVFCLFDPMDDVQATSARLLGRHFPSLPNTFLDFAGDDDDKDNSVVMWALRLCANPKTMHTHSGSQLLSLVCRKAGNPELQVRVVGLILTKLLDQLAVARISLQRAASRAPMHGLLLALRSVLRLDHDNRRYAIKDSIEEILDVTEQIVQYVLGVLSSRSSQDTVVPSFGEMGVAIEDVVVTDANSPTTSSEHQLVLSCCWLSLKESCLLIGNVVHLYLLDPKDDKNNLALSLVQVRRAARILLSVLTKCRHRGVIESCDDGFELLCRTLLDSGQPSLISIVSDMLSEALVELEDGSSVLSTSVTRRSAGLALLIATIIRCDRRPSTPLLTDSVKRLLVVAEKPLLKLSPADDGLVDVPQAHAFHVFKALVHDAALSQDILRDVAPITMVCLRGFYSSSWAVRNAALQLFGACVPTIVGQKKSSDNDENVDDDDAAAAASPKDGNQTTTTFSEFFARWPQLGRAIEEQMSLTSALSGLRPTVVPILSLLCSLAPDESDRVEALCARVRPLLASNVWHVRYSAAQFIAGTCRTQSARRKLFEDVCRRLCMCTEITSNERHGKLVLLKYLIVTISPSEKPLDDQLTGELLSTVVHMSLSNWSFCPVLGATALEIIDATPKWMLPSACWWSRVHKDKLFTDSVCKLGIHSGKPGFSGVLKRTHLGKLQACRSIKDIFREMPAETAAVEELEAYSAALHQLAPSSGHLIDDRDMREQWCENGRHLSAFLRMCSDRRVLVNEILQIVMTAYTRMRIEIISLSEALSFVKKSDGHQFCFTSAIALAVCSTTIDADLRKYHEMWPKPSVIEVNIKCFFEHLRRFCEPRMSEHFRLWAARSLTNCAARVLSTFERTDHGNNLLTKTRRLEYIICEIFDCCVTLLQDEQPDVRKEAMRSVISLQCYHIDHELPAEWRTRRPVPPVHSNVAIQMLSDHFVSRFAWNQELPQYLWRNVGGCVDQQEYAFCLSTVANSSTHSRLFDQDEVNVYAEKCFMSRFFGHIIERIVLKSSCSAEWSWLLIDQVETRARLLIDILASSGEVNVELLCRPDVARLVFNMLAQLDVLLLLQHHFKNSDGGVRFFAKVVVEIRDDLRRQIGLPVGANNRNAE